ncbi:MAG: DegT/DnrJ/EryC1/StrS family aminotransferase [Gemmatimonadales bacterium]
MTVTRRVEIAAPFFTEEDRARIHAGVEEILSGALSMGPNVKAFEQEFARRSGVGHAVAMNACTSALEISLAALGLAPGDEVIVPPLTFIATGMAVHLAGGRPVFAELSEDTLCLDFEDVKRRVTPRTRGVILVYFAGLMPSGLEEFARDCRERGLFLIEDAAHAPGARRRGRAAGSWGDTGCFSFYPTKIITAGEGGMLTTNDDALAAVARSLQHRGRDLTAAQEQYALAGRNVRMTELTALVGRVQLDRLDEYLAARRAVVAHYADALAGDTAGRLILADEPEASSYWKLPLLLEPGRDREIVAARLREAGVQSDAGYSPAMHLQPVMRRLYGTREGLLPRSEALLARLLCLPCHPLVAPEDVERAVEALTA